MATSRHKQHAKSHVRTSRSPRPSRTSNIQSASPFIRPARTFHVSDTPHMRRTPKRGIIFAVLALVVLLAFGFHSCTANRGPTPYYPWKNFSQEGQFYTYASKTLNTSKTGIDVSENQGEIAWETVYKSGIDFAFIRIGYRGTTEGGLFVDDYFYHNLENAQKAGIECGVYFFSQAITIEEAREEAAYVLKLLDGAPLEYPVVFDYEMKASGIESRVENIDSETATAIARVFCETIEAAGYKTMLYGNGYDLGHYNLDELEEIPLWYAEYGALPGLTRSFEIWQYANEGSLDGIDTPVDLNLDFRIDQPLD